MKQYASTRTLCEVYEVNKEFFLRRKQRGEFLKNIHYIEKSNTIRWDLEEIARWWFGDVQIAEDVQGILDNVIPV